MDGQGSAGELDHGVNLLVAALRARGGVGAVSGSCHRDVPTVAGVVLTVIAAHAGRIILSDSGPHGDQLEDLHATIGEGPCIDAGVIGQPVVAADLDHPRAKTRWPRFAAQALRCDIRGIFAYPVLLHAGPIGVLSAYRDTAGLLSPTEDERVQRYARATAVLLLDHQPDTAGGVVDLVLPVRAGEVQQAIGVVMEYAGIDAATALHRLRVYARDSARPMRDVVADVRACRLPFDPTAAT